MMIHWVNWILSWAVHWQEMFSWRLRLICSRKPLMLGLKNSLKYLMKRKSKYPYYLAFGTPLHPTTLEQSWLNKIKTLNGFAVGKCTNCVCNNTEKKIFTNIFQLSCAFTELTCMIESIYFPCRITSWSIKTAFAGINNGWIIYLSVKTFRLISSKDSSRSKCKSWLSRKRLIYSTTLI